MNIIKTKKITGFNDKTLANLAETSKIEGLPEKLIKMREDLNSGFSQDMVDEGIQKRIEDGSLAAMTIEDNSVESEKLKEHTIEPRKTTFFSKMKNMFDITTATSGYAINTSTGDSVANSNSVISDYILVAPGQILKTNYYGYIASYDRNKTFISGSGATLNAASNYSYTVSENAFYIRYSIQGVNNAPKSVLAELEMYDGKYHSYGEVIFDNSYLDVENIVSIIKNNNYMEGLIEASDTNLIGNIPNIYNVSTITEGQSLNAATGAILTGSNYVNCFTSDFIKLRRVNGEIYANTLYCSKYIFICFYDSEQKYISGINGVQPKAEIQIPENTYYIRIASPSLDNKNLYISENELAPKLMKYGTIYFKDTLIDKIKFYGWNNKKWVSFGHSLVGQNKWQPIVASELGLIHTNCGIGGSKVCGTSADAMWTDARINAIPEDTELITILAGTNDHDGTDNIGEWGSTDTNTFYGAYCTMLDKMYARCPNARIVILTDLWKHYEIYKGTNLEDYRVAERKIAYEYGYPLLDTKQLCGFNEANKTTFFASDNGVYIHVNETGGKRLAEVVIGFLKTITPLN